MASANPSQLWERPDRPNPTAMVCAKSPKHRAPAVAVRLAPFVLLDDAVALHLGDGFFGEAGDLLEDASGVLAELGCGTGDLGRCAGVLDGVVGDRQRAGTAAGERKIHNGTPRL